MDDIIRLRLINGCVHQSSVRDVVDLSSGQICPYHYSETFSLVQSFMKLPPNSSEENFVFTPTDSL